MEPLLVLIGLIVLAIPVAIIVLIVGQVRLSRRVRQLETHIQSFGVDIPTATTRRQPPKPTELPDRKSKPAPWSAPKKQDAKAEDSDEVSPHLQSPPAAVVFREDRLAALTGWLRENWFYAVSALSLALAGIFLVQYGVESGLLPPTARVVAALIFGAALIVAGEVIRRRFGDDESSATAYLPSVFSGAGLVTLFGGILAARQLYDLIGPKAALGAMVLVALVGLVLGWFHGPLLAAVGLVGAFSAPFLVGGTSEDPSWLYGYFFVVAVLGLGIDTVRRWAWISLLALFASYAATILLVAGSPDTQPAFLVCVTALALVAVAIPNRRIWPDHDGSTVSEIVRRKKGEPWPEFPTRLAFGSVAGSSVLLTVFRATSIADFWLSVVLFVLLVIALIGWARDARALQDTAIFPSMGLISYVLAEGMYHGPAERLFAQTYAETVEADAPMAVTVLVAIGVLISALAAWRSFRATQYKVVWAGAAVVFAPALSIALELSWHPANVIGAYPWALHAIALGAMMVVLAERFARADGENRTRPALAALSAMSCLTFACVIVLSSAALTIALVATVVVAAALDRKFTLPLMSWFIWAGVFTVTVRLVLNPGLEWADSAPLTEVALVYATATVGFIIGWVLLLPLDRPIAKMLLESAAWATAGILFSLLLLRWLEGLGEGGARDSHWGLGLLSVIWLLLAYAQVQRFELGGRLNFVRYLLAAFFAGHGLWRLMQALTVANPVLTAQADPVLGPPVLNTLAIAYLLPAMAVAFSAWRISSTPLWLKQISFGVALTLSVVWLGMTIRHVWQGAGGMYGGNGVTQPELYTYTMTLLVIGAVLFYQSLARRSDLMRKAGLAVIGLAVAKVFLIDISGLGGLIRVFSLLALGLALAGLAWLNRWAKLRHSPHGPEPLDH